MTTTAIILTGGRSRRFGGIHKPGVDLDGRTVLSRILGTVRAGLPGAEVWVAGRTDGLGPGEAATVHSVVEEPRFAGPLAAIAAAVTAADELRESTDDGPTAFVAEEKSEKSFTTNDAEIRAAGEELAITFVVAGDMPLIEADHVRALAAECRRSGRPASGTDDRGKLQFLCSVWPTSVLRSRLRDIGDVADRPVRLLFSGVDIGLVPVDPTTLLDFDTPEEFTRVSDVRMHGRVRRPIPTGLFAARDAAVRELGLDPRSLGDGEVAAVLDFAARIKHSESGLSPVLATYLAGLLHSTAGIGVDEALSRVEDAIRGQNPAGD